MKICFLEGHFIIYVTYQKECFSKRLYYRRADKIENPN
jgi:hypothetical protein